jgi:hypothetical protein
MTLQVPERLEKQLERAAAERGVSQQTLVEQALEAFLQSGKRVNANGYVIPSFAGVARSQDPSWIDRHEELLQDADGDHR